MGHSHHHRDRHERRLAFNRRRNERRKRYIAGHELQLFDELPLRRLPYMKARPYVCLSCGRVETRAEFRHEPCRHRPALQAN